MSKSYLKLIQENKKLFYLYALGICVMCGKQAALWQSACVLYGVWSFFVATVVCAIANLSLAFCLAEMVSIIPFSGGCYGYVRCTLGPTIGFMTGCFEAAKYTMYAVVIAYLIGLLFQDMYEFEDHWLPVIWLAFYVLAIAFKTVPLNWSIYVWVGLALMTLITQGIFIFGAAKGDNWKNLSPDINPFNRKVGDFLQAIGVANFLLVGIDSVRTCMDDESNKVVPYVMVTATLVSIGTGLASIISMRAYSMNPFLFVTSIPFSPGLLIAIPSINAKYVDFFTLPCIVGAGLGFFYSGGKQISSMMDSRLFPSLRLCGWKKLGKVGIADELDGGALARNYAVGENKSNISDMTEEEVSTLANYPTTKLEATIPLMISAIIAYIVLVVCYHEVDSFFPYIAHIVALLSSVEVCCMMGAYLVFSTRFANMDRSFRSPFGMVGALIAIGFWILLFVTTLYYLLPDVRMWEGLSLLVFFVVCMVYYALFASHHQFFSKEEQQKFLKAYIANANKNRRKGRGGFRAIGYRTGLGKAIWGNLQAAARVVASSSSSSRLQDFSSINREEKNSSHHVQMVCEE